MTREYRLERSQWIARRRSEVFAFFSDAQNLEAITPRSLGFRILSPTPIAMAAGTRIDYRLSLWGVPVRWRTLITEFEPDVRFVDVQEKGPYAHWHHLHEFEAEDGGTRMRDRVTYRLPFGPLGTLAHALLVERQLCTIFDYRARVIPELLAAPSNGRERERA
jgi:ligand-binding SRPBCC domain-containing protein